MVKHHKYNTYLIQKTSSTQKPHQQNKTSCQARDRLPKVDEEDNSFIIAWAFNRSETWIMGNPLRPQRRKELSLSCGLAVQPMA